MFRFLHGCYWFLFHQFAGHFEREKKKKGAEQMSKTKTNGQVLSGELTANGLLNLLSYEPPKYRIPTNLKKGKKRK
jgi:hypothetical protein